MHAYVIVEPLLLGLWLWIVRAQWKKGAFGALFSIPVLVLPFSAVSEIVNLTLFRGVGTFYPASLAWFPAYRFPVAILLLMGLIAHTVDWAAGFVVIRSPIRSAAGRKTLRCAAFLVGILLSFPVESIGTGIGYWRYQVIPSGALVLAQLYAFYAGVIIPPVLLHYGIWAMRKRPGQS